MAYSCDFGWIFRNMDYWIELKRLLFKLFRITKFRTRSDKSIRSSILSKLKKELASHFARCGLTDRSVAIQILTLLMWQNFNTKQGTQKKPVGMETLIFASQGLRFGSAFSPPLADLEYILRIHVLIFHWLRLPVHVSNQKTFYTEHMLSAKCKQKWHRNALIWQRFATSRFGSNENIFPVCQSFETFTWLTVSASKLNSSQISFYSLGAAIFNSPT